MIEFIEGTFISNGPTHVIINTNGIGYRIFTPTTLLSNLPTSGAVLKLFTTFIVRETAFTLYGFETLQTKELFEVLIGVSGIGPKTALALVSTLTYEQLISAVQEGDSKLICKTPGIGKKTAERLILEIKDKVFSLSPTLTSSSPLLAKIERLSLPTHLVKDAMSALINLGYKQAIAEKAITDVVSNTEEKIDLSQLISKALKYV
jgi:holliday junction DNA helicase RuvA